MKVRLDQLSAQSIATRHGLGTAALRLPWDQSLDYQNLQIAVAPEHVDAHIVLVADEQ